MDDDFLNFIFGCIVTFIFIVLCANLFGRTPQDYYREVHTGVVKCIDRPDRKVYCYRTDKKGE